ncbi:MAG: hypothetical protein KY454_00495 [Actinobacteria bacterium]|nr:hypothetical protein [Actinomycetota bacterium]MBW3650482.1 hypothetical protein [Actinomycetota bacterium]
MADAGRSPLEQALDLVLYAPVGIVLSAQENLPDLVAKGRERVAAQVALARMIGQFAVREGEKEARRRFDGVTATLAGLGLLPPPEPAPANPPQPSAAVAPEPQSAAPAAGSSNGKSDAVAEPRPTAELAIPGYDTLSASQVVQRLAGLSREELDAVRAYEASTRARRTILSKISQLQSGPPT